jgi:hypothetical protein
MRYFPNPAIEEYEGIVIGAGIANNGNNHALELFSVIADFDARDDLLVHAPSATRLNKIAILRVAHLFAYRTRLR